MSDVVNRTTVQYLTSVNTPDFPSGTWIINPDLSLLLDIVDQKFWKVVVDDVVEMTTPEKDAVLAAELVVLIDSIKEIIKSRLSLDGSIEGFFTPVSTSGLIITVDVAQLIVADDTTAVADPSLVKTVKVTIVFNITSDSFSIIVFERTNGLYSDLTSDERLAFIFGEFTVAAAGTVLVPV